jgi:hypothetical protein
LNQCPPLILSCGLIRNHNFGLKMFRVAAAPQMPFIPFFHNIYVDLKILFFYSWYYIQFKLNTLIYSFFLIYYFITGSIFLLNYILYVKLEYTSIDIIQFQYYLFSFNWDIIYFENTHNLLPPALEEHSANYVHIHSSNNLSNLELPSHLQKENNNYKIIGGINEGHNSTSNFSNNGATPQHGQQGGNPTPPNGGGGGSEGFGLFNSLFEDKRSTTPDIEPNIIHASSDSFLHATEKPRYKEDPSNMKHPCYQYNRPEL